MEMEALDKRSKEYRASKKAEEIESAAFNRSPSLEQLFNAGIKLNRVKLHQTLESAYELPSEQFTTISEKKHRRAQMALDPNLSLIIFKQDDQFFATSITNAYDIR